MNCVKNQDVFIDSIGTLNINLIFEIALQINTCF